MAMIYIVFTLAPNNLFLVTEQTGVKTRASYLSESVYVKEADRPSRETTGGESG